LPSGGVFNPGVEGHDPSIPTPEFNPDLARELLANSTYDGRRVELLVRTGDWQEDVAVVVMEMARAVGFDMHLDLVDFSVFLPRLTTGEFDVFNLTTGHIQSSARTVLFEIPTNMRRNDIHNMPGSQPIIDVAAQWMAEVDMDRRNELAQEANRLISELTAPRIVLMEHTQTQAVDYGITGIRFLPDGTFQFQYVDFDPSLIP
jgi:ABC-type transport system substrate-binding protein